MKINKLKIKIYHALKITLVALSFNVLADTIPVHFIVGADSNSGSNAAVSSSELATAIDQLNSAYNSVGVDFELDKVTYLTNSDVDDINNTGDDEWDSDNEEDVRPWFDRGSLNVIIPLEMSGNGHAYWDYEATDVIEVESEEIEESTIAHEFGHNTSLKHTYQDYDEQTIAVMEGSGGWQYGDGIIDTPVDPGDRDFFDECVWVGDEEDSTGQEYDPDGFNYMGKGQNTCRDTFSNGQKTRLRYVLATHKFHLYSKYGDSNPTCANSTQVSSFPHSEGFNTDESVSNTPWVQDEYNDDDFDWKYAFDTSTSDTGASSADEGHHFAHIDSSNGFLSSGDEVAMLSPCYNLDNKTAEVSFSYSMHGDDIGELKLEVSTNNGSSWTEEWSKTGEQHSSGSNWSSATVSLDEYDDQQIQLRLTGIVTGGSKGDISVDDIVVSAESSGGGNGGDTTVNISVAQSSDDAEENVSDGSMNITSTDLELVDESGSTEQLVGIRFANANIPQGATITSASVQFTVDDDNTGSVNLSIYAHKSTSSSTFSSSDDNISDRSTTAASVSWSPSDWSTVGASGAAQKTSDLTSIIQELVDQSGWDTNSAVTIIISGNGEREAESYDGSSSDAAVLTITYSEDGGGNGGGSASVQVAQSSDDAEEKVSDGSINLTSSDLELVDESGSTEQLVGIRFQNVGISQGATISSASVQFTVDSVNSGSVSLTIYAHKSANSSTFSSSDDNISDRSATSASVSWSPSSWDTVGEAGSAQQTSDLTAIIQELVDQSGWSSSSAVTIIISGDGEREAESYDGSSSSAALLNVVWQ